MPHTPRWRAATGPGSSLLAKTPRGWYAGLPARPSVPTRGSFSHTARRPTGRPAERTQRGSDSRYAPASRGGERMTKTLITNGTIVTAADTYKADVLVDDEKVAMIGKGLKAAGAKRIDATAKYVIPGGIDVHTHMELPFGGTFASDDFHTGTVAAAFGGTTSIVDFAVQGMGEPLETARDAWLKKARGKASLDYGLP